MEPKFNYEIQNKKIMLNYIFRNRVNICKVFGFVMLTYKCDEHGIIRYIYECR